LETKEPRRFPVEFEGLVRDTDSFEVTIPVGYEVDDLTDPVDTDYSFASYHSKTEVNGSVLRYTGTFEIKELIVPVCRTEELRKFYRTIASDERGTVVLTSVAKSRVAISLIGREETSPSWNIRDWQNRKVSEILPPSQPIFIFKV
jgi:hypothetical protein